LFFWGIDPVNIQTKKSINAFVFVSLAIFLNGCGKETAGSDDNQQIDRDREKSNVIAKNYAEVNGTYSGLVNNSDVFLIVSTSKVTKDGSTVPVPTLVGTLVFSPRVVIGNTNERVKVFFPYTDGTYDDTSGDFSFTVEKEARPSQVRCKATPVQFDCSWYRRMNNTQFTLTRDRDDALDTLNAHSMSLFGGDYVGKTPDGLLVKASFNPGLANRPDSMIPELTVISTFIFYPADQNTPADNAPIQDPMTSTDGAYDVSTGIIAMTMNSDSGSFVVNCLVETTDSLFCHWYSRKFMEFRLKKESIAGAKPNPKKNHQSVGK
jgi:hypothetical protein